MNELTATFDANQMATQHQQTVILAEQLGYQGTLSIGALEDGIRFYQGRTVEACLELGKCLLILKEMCPHGEFTQRIEMLGINPRMAQKFMQAVLKFAKTNSNSLLQAAGSQTKLLELVTLDDESLEALSNGEAIGGITLDDIETMSVSELKKALRNARADSSAKDELITKKNAKIDELDARLTKAKKPTPNEALAEQNQLEQNALHQLSQDAMSALTAVLKLQRTVIELRDFAEEHSLRNLPEQIDQTINATYQRIAQASADAGIAIDFAELVTPSWMAELLPQTGTAPE